MKNLVLKGKIGNKGYAEGEALVTKDSICFFGGIDPQTGTITEIRSTDKGKNFKGKIFVIESTKGSSGVWVWLSLLGRLGNAPRAIVMTRGDPLVVGGSIDADIPYVFDLERNPTEVIKTGDYVKVNGDKGTVEIMSK